MKNSHSTEFVLQETLDPGLTLVEKGEVDFFHNGEMLSVGEFPLDKDFPLQSFSFAVEYGNKNYQTVSGWIGRLMPRSGVKGGMRCYKLGRLICGREFFGQPDANYGHCPLPGHG